MSDPDTERGADQLNKASLAAAAGHKPLREQKWAIVSAACVAGVMIGYGLSGFAPKTPDWKRDAAEHHALYRGWTVIALTPSPAELQADLAKASDAISARLSDAVMTSSGTLTPKRVDVLGVGELRLAQVIFASPGGTPIGLYALKRRNPADWSPDELIVQAITRANLATATWATPDADFLLAGGEDLNRIEALATQLSHALYREHQ